MKTKIKTTETVESLRKQGFRVFIQHEYDPNNCHGGKTSAELVSPDGQLTATGEARCVTKDSYNRKRGVKISLGRAIKQYNLLNYF